MLIAAGMGEGDDALAGTALRLALVGHLGLGVQGVAVEERLRERDLAEAQVADDRALGQLRHRQPDERRQREHRVHQSLVERRQRVGEGGIEMQRLGVHRQRGEQDVVGFGDGAAGPVLVERRRARTPRTTGHAGQ